MKYSSLIQLMLLVVLNIAGLTLTLEAAEPVDFSRDIRPLLSDRCFECHGPDEEARESDVRLDTAARPEHKGLIVPGKPAESELFQRINSSDRKKRMPPTDSGKELSPDEIELIRRWIEEGAEWSSHWAHVSPVRHEAPQTSNSRWGVNLVDPFVLSRIEAAGLAPSPDADATTLCRRLHFDLTGLPPRPDDVDAFALAFKNDPQAAVEKLVDRLLATDAYAERMTVYWLDLVRYADTVGYHGDQDHHISPYRDWVIDAFIRNMPFDQFTREQLAGDLLPNSNVDQKIATGYNRLLQTSHEGGVQPKEYIAMYMADRIRNVSAVWFGATIGCAQCHNHKYDPYTSQDFYSLGAFFADVDETKHLIRGTDSSPTRRLPEIKVHTRLDRERLLELKVLIESAKVQLAELPKDTADKIETTQQRLDALTKEHATLEKNPRLTMVTAAVTPRTTRILPRGDWLDESGPIVQPAIPEFLGRIDLGDRRANRLDLAGWLTDAENGAGLLTARVMVNRFWYLLFGHGLARHLDDFGGQGEPPTHPELLDRLAHEYVGSGWDTKHMLRLLATSRAYRQSSVGTDELRDQDPENRLFARQSRFRIPAEFVRDNALFVSGLLVQKVGGPSVKPYQPAGYYRHLNFPTRKYQQHNDERQWRRGLYVHWQRQFLHPMLKNLDAPRREECTALRIQTNTPLASLTLLNDPTFVETARVFGARIVREGGKSDETRINFTVRLVLSRLPDDHERELLHTFTTNARKHFADNEKAAAELASVGMSSVPIDIPITELATWTTVARAIFNTNEFSMRN